MLPGAPGGQATSINNEGTVTGFSSTADGLNHHAVRWSASGTLTDLGALTENTSAAGIAINGRGVVLGQADPQDGTGHAVRWSRSGVPTDLGANTSAIALNDRGTVAGSSDRRPVRWSPAGTLEELRLLPGTGEGTVTEINDGGVMAGRCGDFFDSRAVRWDSSGAVTALGDLGGGRAGVQDLNNRGAMVGGAQTANGESHAVRW